MLKHELKRQCELGNFVGIYILREDPSKFTMCQVLHVGDEWFLTVCFDVLGRYDGLRLVKTSAPFKIDCGTAYLNDRSPTSLHDRAKVSAFIDEVVSNGPDFLAYLATQRFLVEIGNFEDFPCGRISKVDDTCLALDLLDTDLLAFDGSAVLLLEDVEYLIVDSQDNRSRLSALALDQDSIGPATSSPGAVPLLHQVLKERMADQSLVMLFLDRDDPDAYHVRRIVSVFEDSFLVVRLDSNSNENGLQWIKESLLFKLEYGSSMLQPRERLTDKGGALPSPEPKVFPKTEEDLLKDWIQRRVIVEIKMLGFLEIGRIVDFDEATVTFDNFETVHLIFDGTCTISREEIDFIRTDSPVSRRRAELVSAMEGKRLA